MTHMAGQNSQQPYILITVTADAKVVRAADFLRVIRYLAAWGATRIVHSRGGRRVAEVIYRIQADAAARRVVEYIAATTPGMNIQMATVVPTWESAG